MEIVIEKVKNILIAVTGGIAAYKAVEVVSRLKKKGYNVEVAMTRNAKKFVSPLTFQSISHNLVYSEMFSEPTKWDIEHIALAKKADLIAVVPATANIIGKVANGIADDLITTTIMASKSPVLFVPAMNHNMYENKIVQKNIEFLKSIGYCFIEPEVGQMAEGSVGKGRLPEPAAIVDKIVSKLEKKRDLDGLKVLVTSGPTREPIDPVRFISNRSTGKMGFSIAKEASERGADVKVVSGPVDLDTGDLNVTFVNTALEMYQEVMRIQEDYDVFIMVAAVSDYRPLRISENKIKKGEQKLTLELVKNPDIAYELGKIKGDRVMIGFCAETEELINNAIEKINTKNFDFIVANNIIENGAGFEVDTNIATLIFKDGNKLECPLMEKKKLASIIIDNVVKINTKKQNHINKETN